VRATASYLVVLAALLALPATALASDQIAVSPEGAAARTVALSQLEPDVQAREYTIDDGTGERRVPITGYSLDKVLDAANVDPYRFADVQVTASAGLSVTLDREEVISQGTFADGPPVFWMEGDEARFLRPVSAAGGSMVVHGGAIAVGLARQSELQVSASASPRRVKAGEPVTFTASVSGAGGEAVELRWYFDGDGSATGPRVTHRFSRRGSYDVLLGATTASDSTGADAIVTVQVGRPGRGPNRKGGGTNEDANAPDSGAATGPGGPGGGSSGVAGGSTSGVAGGSTAGGDTAAPQESAAARRRAARRADARRRAARRERREEQRDSETAEAGSSREVTGIELADLSALSSPAGRDALEAARTGRLRDEQDGSGGGVPPVVWWTLGTAALLGLGGWREARGRPTARVT
jgi:PKD domain